MRIPQKIILNVSMIVFFQKVSENKLRQNKMIFLRSISLISEGKIHTKKTYFGGYDMPQRFNTSLANGAFTLTSNGVPE